MAELARVSRIKQEAPGFPVESSTLYKWHCLGIYPELFVKLNGALFVNLHRFKELVDRKGRPAELPRGKGSDKANWRRVPFIDPKLGRPPTKGGPV